MTEPKRIFVDGRYIGDITATGDNMKDMEAAAALLRASGAYRKITPEQVMFGQATAFANTASYLFNNDLLGVPARNPASAGPFVVNAAFALELYLKTLNRTYGNDPGREHDLLILFDALPVEAKKGLHAQFPGAPSSATGVTDMATFRTAIDGVRHAFKEWRYLHERHRSSEIRFQELIFVLNVVHNTCRFDTRLRSSEPTASYTTTGTSV